MISESNLYRSRRPVLEVIFGLEIIRLESGNSFVKIVDVGEEDVKRYVSTPLLQSARP